MQKSRYLQNEPFSSNKEKNHSWYINGYNMAKNSVVAEVTFKYKLILNLDFLIGNPEKNFLFVYH